MGYKERWKKIQMLCQDLFKCETICMFCFDSSIHSHTHIYVLYIHIYTYTHIQFVI